MWLIIDGNNWFAQCELANPQPGNGVGNFLRRLHTLRRQVEHSQCFVAWDSPRSFRHDLLDSYKAGRSVKPPSYHAGLAECQSRVRQLLGGTSLVAAGYEADDVIASLSRWADGEGERTAIFSADKDLHQLLAPDRVTQITQVTRYSVDRLQFVTMTATALEKRFGVSSSQWVDYRVLTGDKSDGLAGCPGIGDRAAAELLRAVGTLDAYYRDTQSRWKTTLTPRKLAAIDQYRDQVPLVRRLVRLVDSVPLAIGNVLEIAR